MTAPPAEALSLQRPLPNQVLRVVARGAKKDGDDRSSLTVSLSSRTP